MEDLVGHSKTTDFWHGRRVFVTGHTGFKGSWLALWLISKGAVVRGYSLDPSANPNLFSLLKLANSLDDIRGDIRDSLTLQTAMRSFAPEVVFHLAAQPLVRASYDDPIGTLETNIIGTAKVLEAVRQCSTVRAVVNVTTDKCYENREWVWAYRESDPLGGFDPYSSSKACSEIVSAAYRQSFFSSLGKGYCGLATARAGNVIGGGDWSEYRLIPDVVRGIQEGRPIIIRSPHSIRPWQFVLEPLHGYLLLAERLFTGDPRYATAYNFGPDDSGAQPVAWLVETLIREWSATISWHTPASDSKHEAIYLKLDASRAKTDLNWQPRMSLTTTIQWLVEWYKAWINGDDMRSATQAQIKRYQVLIG